MSDALALLCKLQIIAKLPITVLHVKLLIREINQGGLSSLNVTNNSNLLQISVHPSTVKACVHKHIIMLRSLV